MTGPSRLDRLIEFVLTGGLAASAVLLLGGLLSARATLLWWGVLVLLLTPVVRVVVVTVALIQTRDWLFAAVSLWILGVLASSFYVAFAVEGPRARAARAAQAPAGAVRP